LENQELKNRIEANNTCIRFTKNIWWWIHTLWLIVCNTISIAIWYMHHHG